MPHPTEIVPHVRGAGFSAIYRRPCGLVRAAPIAYSTLGSALLGPASNVYLGDRCGYLERARCGPPVLHGLPVDSTVELA